jgi:hypothetical protein
MLIQLLSYFIIDIGYIHAIENIIAEIVLHYTTKYIERNVRTLNRK